MVFWLSVIIGVSLIIIMTLSLRLMLVRRSLCRISRDLAERLSDDTNVLIDVSSGDRAVRELAAGLNRQLAELRRQRNRFEHGDLELKEAITNISHDLRTPLTSIYGYLNLLKGEALSADGRLYAEAIEERTDAMKKMTEELFGYTLVVSDTEELPKQMTDVRAIVESCLSSYYAVFKEKGIEPAISLPERKVELMLNEDALRRVFENIISNAVKYTDGDLRVDMTAGGMVTFSNHAAGLTELQTERLFDRFYTVNTARKSTGLGLAIARTLTEKMGMEIGAVCEDQILKVWVRPKE